MAGQAWVQGMQAAWDQASERSAKSETPCYTGPFLYESYNGIDDDIIMGMKRSVSHTVCVRWGLASG